MAILLSTTAAVVLAPVVVILVLSRGSTWAELQRGGHPPDVFVCKPRRAGKARWPRRRARAMWVHDVLIVKTGCIYPRICALPVRLPEDVIREALPGEVSGLGPRPAVITLRLDDERLIDVASSVEDRSLLVGPFCAAAIKGLPTARVERLPWKPTGSSRKSDPKKRD